MIHLWRPWKLSRFQGSHPLVHLRPKFCHLLDFGRTPNFKWTSPLQMITNQLKDNIIQVWLLYVIKSFLQVDFRIHYQLINLVWLSFLFFSFNLSITICFWWILYSCVCSCPKLSRNVFYLQLFTFLVLILRSTCFVCITRKR